MSVQDMMSQEHYISIFTLTYEFDRGEGLQQIHYRYVLQENPGLTEYYQNKMKRYFGNDLEKLFKESDMLEKMGNPRRIYRNCIKTGTHLSYFLNQMVKHGILDRKTTEDGKKSYVLKEFNYFIYPIKMLVRRIKDTAPTTINFFYPKGLDVGNFNIDKGVFFDIDFLKLPEVMFNPIDQHQKKEFKTVMNNLSIAVFDFGEYVKKVIKPNAPYQNSKTQLCSHEFGIYVDCKVFNKKTHEKLLKEKETNENEKTKTEYIIRTRR